MKNKKLIYGMIFGILITALVVSSCARKEINKKEITNFEECAKAGYPIGESYPRQCFAPDKTFIEELSEKEIITDNGYLLLKYENGKAILSGTLKRSTPCVNWTVQIGGTKDLPKSEVTIKIFDKNKGVICIQMLGEPQEMNTVIDDVTKNTNYEVIFENKRVFEGKLNE